MTHSSVTSLLLFHRFLDQNPHYRASMRLPPLEAEQPVTVERPLPTDEPATSALAGEEEEGDDDEDENLTRQTSDWNLNFTPMSEEELMVGHVVKDRLLRLLDHPELRNHLLKRKNLLLLLVSPTSEFEDRANRRDGKVPTCFVIVERLRGILRLLCMRG